MIAIFLKEINSFLNSLVAYIVISIFLISIGLLIWVFPETNVMNYGYASMETLFVLAPYVFIFLIPAITMRTFAEEKNSGTMELLLTRPLSDMKIIIGKFLGCFSLVIFTLSPTLLYYYTIYQLGSPVGNIDTAGVIGSYFGLILLGGVFTSIGIFSSSIASSQIIAFVIAAFLCFIFYTGFSALAGMDIWGEYAYWIAQLGIHSHYNAMSRGLLDIRDMIYFISIIVGILISAQLFLRKRK